MNLSNQNLEIHLLLFVFLIILAGAAGFVLGRIGAQKSGNRILEVENDMLAAHEEVLKYAEHNKKLTESLEKAKAQLQSMNVQFLEEGKDEKVRKLPLGKIG
jgi:F0F1-type ATP synthase membrane subunit b/b'